MIRPAIALAIALCPLLAACTEAPPQHANANTPGYTGSTVVRGDSSTLAGDAEATYLQRSFGVRA
jgi:hypothetical protein